MDGRELQSLTIPTIYACQSSSEMWHDVKKSVDVYNLQSSFGEHCKDFKPGDGLCLGGGRQTDVKIEDDVCLTEYSKVENNSRLEENGARQESGTGTKLKADGDAANISEHCVQDRAVSERECTSNGATSLLNHRPDKEISCAHNESMESTLPVQDGLPLGHSSGTDSESEVTEVEVRVDPMLFLCTLDDACNDDDDDDDDSAEFSSLSSCLTSPQENVIQETPPPRVQPSHPPPPVPPQSVGKETKPYRCSICLRGFNNEIGLQNHLWSHLPSERRVLSTSDSSNHPQRPSPVYSSRGVLHTSSSVTTAMRFVCPICGKKISTKGNLKVHLETHRPKGKYGCDICGRVFKTQSNLYRHKDYHGGIQFPCSVCGRVYPTNSTLRAHSITHSDLRPHACPLCDKTFKRNQDLKCDCG